MLKAYACAGDHEGARAHLRQMVCSQVVPTHRTFGKIMKAAAKGGLPKESEKAWHEFLHSLRTANSAPLRDEDFRLKVNMMIDAAANVGDVERAKYWLHQLGEAMADCWSYAGVLKACASQSNAAEAVSCLKEMQVKRIAADSVCFVAAIAACGRSGDVDKALDLLKQMQHDCQATCQADFDAASNSVLNAFAKSSNVAGAEQWLVSSQTTPTLQMYHTLLDAAGRAGVPERAEHFFRRMLAAGHQPTALTAGSLITAVLGRETSRSGIDGKFKPQLELLQSLNLNLDKSAPVHLALINAFSRSAAWTSALNQLHKMSEDGVLPCLQAYTSAITACARALHLCKVKHLFDDISNARLRRDVVVYGSCIHAAVKSRDRSLAEDFLRQMLDECIDPNERMLQSLGKVLSVEQIRQHGQRMPKVVDDFRAAFIHAGQHLFLQQRQVS